jgi:hypothetical protein
MRWRACAGALAAAMLVAGCHGYASWWPARESPHKWTTFVRTEGHANEIPAQWVATPIGRFAHDLKIPNPVPADSGYRARMSSREYWEHLCRTEAGSFIFRTVDNVEGFLFMRPMLTPTDDDIQDRYLFEAAVIQASAQVREHYRNKDPDYPPVLRAEGFVNPPFTTYRFIEFPQPTAGRFWHMYGYVQDKAPMKVETVDRPHSRFGLLWRGIRRPMDRELGISGSEWIVLDLETKEVLGLLRDFGWMPRVRNSPTGVYWLNAGLCPFRHMFDGDGAGAMAQAAEDIVWLRRTLKPIRH